MSVTLGEYLKECRIAAKKSQPTIGAELFGSGKFLHYQNEPAFVRILSCLENGTEEKNVKKRNAKLFDGRLALWAQAYEASETKLKELVEKDEVCVPKTSRAEKKTSNSCWSNLFLVFTVLKDFPGAGEDDLRRVMQFVEGLDVALTRELVHMYASNIIK